MKKKGLTLLLSCGMTLSLIPALVFAEEPNESQKFDIWVGGIQVTADNAHDVLGDADTAQTVIYDPEMEALILKGAKIDTGYEYTADCVAGIYADGDLNIILEGGADEAFSSAISAPDSAELSCGIRVTGRLTISGDGMLTSSSGTVTASDTIVEDDFVIGAGIYASQGLEILGYIQEDENEAGETPIVTAIGGTVTGNQNCSAYSDGVYTIGSVNVSSGGILTASGSAAEGYHAYSVGIEVHGKTQYENITVEEGTLTSTSGPAAGVASAQSSSIYANNCGLYVSGDASAVNLYNYPATVSSADGQAYQIGLFAAGGEMRMHGGHVAIDSMKADESSDQLIVFGIYATKTEEGEGGGISLSDHSDTGAHPSLAVKTSDGFAIYTEGSIDLDDCIDIAAPEGGSILSTEEDPFFLVVDAEQNPASEFCTGLAAEHE